MLMKLARYIIAFLGSYSSLVMELILSHSKPNTMTDCLLAFILAVILDHLNSFIEGWMSCSLGYKTIDVIQLLLKETHPGTKVFH